MYKLYYVHLLLIILQLFTERAPARARSTAYFIRSRRRHSFGASTMISICVSALFVLSLIPAAGKLKITCAFMNLPWCTHYNIPAFVSQESTSVRLLGVDSSRGRGELQLLDGGEWTQICSGSLDPIEAQLACRELGFPFFLYTDRNCRRVSKTTCRPI